MESNYTISVITVVKDDPAGFQKTLNSVSMALKILNGRQQESVEYLVIDSSIDKSEIVEVVQRESVPAQLHWLNLVASTPP